MRQGLRDRRGVWAIPDRRVLPGQWDLLVPPVLLALRVPMGRLALWVRLDLQELPGLRG